MQVRRAVWLGDLGTCPGGSQLKKGATPARWRAPWTPFLGVHAGPPFLAVDDMLGMQQRGLFANRLLGCTSCPLSISGSVVVICLIKFGFAARRTSLPLSHLFSGLLLSLELFLFFFLVIHKPARRSNVR
jgi:hypothetical protein